MANVGAERLPSLARRVDIALAAPAPEGEKGV